MPQVPPALRPDDTLMLIVDFQDRLLPAIHEAETCVQTARKTIEAARVLGVPLLCTEQNPAGLGKTCPTLRDVLADAPVVEKTSFTACVEGVTRKLAELNRTNVIVMGIEAHVCVQQTVLDLLRLGYRPYVCADGISSRRPFDRDIAIERMRQAGAIVTTAESVIFELTGEAGTPTFKAILKIVK